MKYLLLYPIKVYQAFFSKYFRGKCLFKESCSCHVYRIANEEGFINGLKALKYRFENCRGNYTISSVGSKKILITSHFTVIDAEYLKEEIIGKA